jgi:ketosteroid isomerase-like protein
MSDALASQPAESEVLRTFDEYFLASIGLDEKRVAACYDEPFMYVSAERSAAVAARADAEAFLRPGFKALQEAGYTKTEFPVLRSQSVGTGLAVVSGAGVRYAKDGTQLATFGVTYIWRKRPEGWRLAVMTVHDPKRPLALPQGM